MTRLKLCGYCALFVLAEVLLYASYRHHDARFHWFLHFLVGASAALLLMVLIAGRRRALITTEPISRLLARRSKNSR